MFLIVDLRFWFNLIRGYDSVPNSPIVNHKLKILLPRFQIFPRSFRPSYSKSQMSKSAKSAGKKIVNQKSPETNRLISGDQHHSFTARCKVVSILPKTG